MHVIDAKTNRITTTSTAAPGGRHQEEKGLPRPPGAQGDMPISTSEIPVVTTQSPEEAPEDQAALPPQLQPVSNDKASVYSLQIPTRTSNGHQRDQEKRQSVLSTDSRHSTSPLSRSNNSAAISILEPPPRCSVRSMQRRDSGLAPSSRSLMDGATTKSLYRELTAEEETTSLRVRGLYSSGISGSGAPSLSGSPRPGSTATDLGESSARLSMVSGISGRSANFPSSAVDKRSSVALIADSTLGMDESGSVMEMERGEHELAGGVEDWEDIDGQDVDRYGFIVPKKPKTPDGKGHQRMSTALFAKSNQPRKASALARHKHLQALITPFIDDKPIEMLQTPLQEVNQQMRMKEFSRTQKWTEMAGAGKVANPEAQGGKGGGMVFNFRTTDSKLIDRTWKGIPDCWRGAAWHSFLTTSAIKRGGCLSDAELTEIYHELLTQNSADDVQIDLDVPRTINSHIMFRKRYRGGQRLLFRVLHSLSLHLPEIGYVQGMASLAATLLCYYDEDMAFIMVIRLFELRGLDRLYSAGFGGLMNALSEFEVVWLRDGPVSRKLNDLGIPVVSYGTRWYLTLFNYSIPFAAQLRVWDVFMLLGDSDPSSISSPTDFGFGGVLDVLHAASCALIEGMKNVILETDFEGAMKVLTSWVPVKDENLMMKVMKTEWKKRKRRNVFRPRTGGSLRPGTRPGTRSGNGHYGGMGK